jgi:predicted amidohydrolase
VGNLPFVQNADIHYAESAIYTPSDIAFDRDGIAASCTPNIETMLIHDIDLERLRRHRYAGNVQNWKDRRSDLYRIEFTENGEIQHI